MFGHVHSRMDMPGMQGDPSPNSADTRSQHMCSLWKWKTIDVCFVSEQWHVTNEVTFAFSIIGIFLVAFLIEGTRRIARNYDRMLSERHAAASKEYNGPLRPTLWEQIVWGILYGIQFSAGFLLMLIAMSHK
ncbi:Copper Transporter integral membrane protein that functions in high affinity copper transport [Ceratobasidium sp. 428]|nr:Copper Transporter integral membrane protein that functions in high affinity copper transport [Ceratobasidium sp. 428]